MATFLIAAGVGVVRAVTGEDMQALHLLGRSEVRWYLLTAVAASSCWLLLGIQAWRYVLAALGSQLNLFDGARVCFAAIVGTYLPGPWFQALAAVHVGRRIGVEPRRMVVAYLLVAVVNLLSAASVGLLAAPLVLQGHWAWLVVPVVLSCTVVWHPRGVIQATAWAARLLRREPVTQLVEPRALRLAMLCQICAWMVGGVHLWLLAVALGGPPLKTLSVAVGAYAFASAAAALILVLPDGAGAKDLLIVGALTVALPVPAAVVAAVASRACVIVAELLVGAGLLLAWRIRRGRQVGRPAVPSTVHT
ncbi:lysylphosphatidylglycerol synthase domain-containing protein [Micromonospora sp. NPDC048935]|uniref:lysylphosphatidylglycerol synthase domain-containing protein n=1 Tax=Micromonospora sp. NPDC048935 TaxID=3364262 RepID=UPI003714242A